jgi:toxin ParE1/3/4
MGFKVIFTPQAQADLQKIVSFIAKNNRERAKSFGHELIDRALMLALLPERGRMVPEFLMTEVREIIHRSYRIIYEIFPDENAVYILRFWHGARGEPEISTDH